MVATLLEIIEVLREQLQEQRDEIARLKGEKAKPFIKPSSLEKHSEDKKNLDPTGKRPGSAKRRKTEGLKIHRIELLRAHNVPAGSRFKVGAGLVAREIGADQLEADVPLSARISK